MKHDPRDVVFELSVVCKCFDYNHKEPWKRIGELVRRLPEDKVFRNKEGFIFKKV